MHSLELLALRPFFLTFHQALISTGLLTGLQTYVGEDAAVQAALHNLHGALVAGQDWESAVRTVSPALPGVLTELLILGAAQANLDGVVAEINRLYHRHPHERELYAALSQAVANLEAGAGSGLICQGCLVETFEKILARAALEKARRVLLSQTGQAYFEQRYLGAKLILVREACHALTYRTLYACFKTASQEGTLSGEGWSQTYAVTALSPDAYQVKSATHTLECVFLTPLSELPQ